MQTFTVALLFFISSIFLQCNQKSQRDETNQEPVFFNPIELGALNQTSHLSIEAVFDECGEWGGHKEMITIYADSMRQLYARWKIYSYNCDSLKYYYGKKELNPTADKIVTVNNAAKRSISEYLHRLTDAKIAERFPGHAGFLFSFANADSTLFIKLYDNKDRNVKSYRKLVAELFR